MIPQNNTKNYIVSYDLNGSVPTHAQVDKHIADFAVQYGRILETVWYVRSEASLKALYEHVNSILSENDRVIVIEARNAWVRNLLIQHESMQQAWALAA